jgi:Flp pilus assembly protein TadG
MNRAILKRITHDRTGIAAVEFAVIAPVFLLILMGGMDIGHTLYTTAVLQGAVQKAARSSALENGGTVAGQNEADAKIREAVLNLNNQANVTITRRFYKTFSTAALARREDWTDSDGNNTCNNNEPFVDANRNGTWDIDGADAGQGGARDVTIYTVTMTYPRLFPTIAMLGYFLPKNQAANFSPVVTLKAQTVLANQPFSDQSQYGAALTGHCL